MEIMKAQLWMMLETVRQAPLGDIILLIMGDFNYSESNLERLGPHEGNETWRNKF